MNQLLMEMEKLLWNRWLHIPLDIDTNNFYDFTEIGPNQASSETATACVSYFSGVNYNTSGTYTFQSIILLDVIV